MTAIDDKWREISWIGQPVDEGAGSEEMAMPDGRGTGLPEGRSTASWAIP